MKIENPKTRKIVIAGAIAFIGVMLYMEFTSRDILDTHGVYTIAQITHVSQHTGRHNISGYKATFTYTLDGRAYSGGNSDYAFNRSMTGRRYFVLVAPGKTRKTKLLYDHPVPDWFTADPPSQGWNRLPSAEELRKIMSGTLKEQR
ncbi:MAG: hypothetical protein LUD76_12615 [Alistipes sp.]|nr:hypothetical protein [Alistipes sp.]